MSDIYALPEVNSTRRFHTAAERLAMGLGAVAAVAGLGIMVRPAFHTLEDFSALAHPSGAPAENHGENWYLNNEGKGGLLLLDGLGVYAVGRLHRDKRQLEEDTIELLHLESLLDPDSAFGEDTDQS